MDRKLVFDWPTRFFHWVFASIFLTAFVIGKTVDEDSVVFSYHMMLGMTLVFSVILRIFWGIWGSKYAKFSEFKLHPKELFEYFKSAVTSKTKLYVGHNPATSWTAILMFILTFGLGFTGIQMASGNTSFFMEDIHELCANGFIVLVIGHILGIAFHTIRHKEIIGMSMLTGTKNVEDPEGGIKKTFGVIGGVFIILVAVFAFNLFSKFDSTNRTLKVFGTVLHLGDDEEGEEEGSSEIGYDNKEQGYDDNDD